MEIKESILETVEFLLVYNANSLINTCKSFNIDPLNIKTDIDKLDNGTLHIFNKFLDNQLPQERSHIENEEDY